MRERKSLLNSFLSSRKTLGLTMVFSAAVAGYNGSLISEREAQHEALVSMTPEQIHRTYKNDEHAVATKDAATALGNNKAMTLFGGMFSTVAFGLMVLNARRKFEPKAERPQTPKP